MAFPGSNFRLRLILEALIGLTMVVSAFAMIGALGINLSGTLVYWSVLVAGYALVTLVADRLYTAHRLADVSSAMKIILHWAGVLLALNVALYFVGSGRMAAADIGLISGLVLGLGTFLAGVHVNWRLMVVGAAIVAQTYVTAYIAEPMWFTAGVVAATVVVLVLGTVLFGRARRGAVSGTTVDSSTADASPAI